MAISVPLKRFVYFEAKFATHCVPHFSLFSLVYKREDGEWRAEKWSSFPTLAHFPRR